MTTKNLFVTCLCASWLAACQSEAPAPPPAPSSATSAEQAVDAPAAVAAAVPAPAQAAVDLESIPAEEDFEEEAEQSITAANLERQLEQLEKELEADAP